VEAFIAGLVAAALLPVRRLTEAVAERVSAIYHNFTDTLGRARNGFLHWASQGASWATASVRHALVVMTAIRWLVLVAIPQWVDQRADQLAEWALSRLGELRALAQGWVSQALSWAAARIGDAVAQLGRLADWVADQLAQLRAGAKILSDRVFGVLGSPESLVAWILGALITALVGYLVDNAERLAERAWLSRDRILVKTLDVTEDFIDRVF